MKSRASPDWSLASTAYNAIAERYDKVPRENRINAYMRRESLETVRAAFPAGSRVLELGFGTGEEAIDLARRGVFVVGVDPSGEMVRQAEHKARSSGVSERIQFLQGRAGDLPRLVSELQSSAFDGGFASFSLAYERDLSTVAPALHVCLNPGAPFIASVPSRLCLVEFLLALSLAKPQLPGSRIQDWHGHKVGDYRVPIHTFTPSSFARLFSPHFTLERVEALPALVPPPYTNRVYAKFGGFADALERFDRRARSAPLLRLVGDHFVAHMRHRLQMSNNPPAIAESPNVEPASLARG